MTTIRHHAPSSSSTSTMISRVLRHCGWWLIVSALVACSPQSAPLAATDLCAQLAQAVCANDQSCCPALSAPSDAGTAVGDASSGEAGPTGDAAADVPAARDGGSADATAAADGGMDAGNAIDGGATAPPTCQSVEQARCEQTLGAMARDARLAYVPSGGGALLAAVQAAGTQCGTTPAWSDIAAMFSGTGTTGANCTPPDASPASLALSEASCTGGNTCRLYLHADGTLDGACQQRAGGDDSCSHPYDCPAQQFCNLGSHWQPGEWGHCQPLLANGWGCTSALDCSSHFCNAVGTCADRAAPLLCLAQTYPTLVGGDLPTIYLRLSATDGTAVVDSSGNGNGGTDQGVIAHAPVGVLPVADDGALQLDGMGGGVIVPDPMALTTAAGFSVEVWFRADDTQATRPLVEFYDPALGAETSLWTAGDGTAIAASFVGSDGMPHAVTSSMGVVTAERWFHVVATFDGSVGLLYVNGQSLGQVSATAPRLGTEIHVGYHPATGMGTMASSFLGRLDEVAVYARALSAQTVAAHYRAGTTGTAQVPYPPFADLD